MHCFHYDTAHLYRLLMYPKNNHPIAEVDAEANGAVNKAVWLLEHLN